MNLETVKYRFVKQHATAVGEAIYLVGSIKELGEWDTDRAIKMNYYNYQYWAIEVEIPIVRETEYKFFIGPYEKQSVSKGISWLATDNIKIKIEEYMTSRFTEESKRELKIMSFNVRFENMKDLGPYSWASRRDNCIELIDHVLPDIVGAQEPKSSQRVSMMHRLGQFYEYYGKPRNLIDDQESGIFLRRDKYRVIEDGYIWINENKVEGKKGFGSRLPRYFTYLVVTPFDDCSESFIVFNTHLDHECHTARLHGVKYISETIKDLSMRYPQITSFFVTGDFNTSDDDPIFKELHYASQKLLSMRWKGVLSEQNSDQGATFNGFSKLSKYVDKALKFFNLDPGATIDHIFFRSESYKPILFQCLRNQERIISDHYPIVGTFHAHK